MTYKRILQVAALCLGIGLAACTPDEIGPIGEVFSKTADMNGDWNLTSITQVDNIALVSENGQSTLDLTPYYSFTDYQLSLGTDRTFAFNAGDAPDYIGKAAGTWMVDDEDLPTQLYLVGSTGDTTKLSLERITLPNTNKLEINVNRFDGEDIYLSYRLVFEK